MRNALRIVGLLEGLSFIALLGIGMPLKYAFGIPMASRVAGMIHGLLFLMFVSVALQVASQENWHWKKRLAAMAAAVLPLGTFWFDRRYLSAKG